MGLSLFPAAWRPELLDRAAAEDALRWAIALALGEVRTAEDVERLVESGRSPGWEVIAQASARERCLGPSWLRNGALLRSVAGATGVSPWRRAAARLDEVGCAQLRALGDILDAMRDSAVPVVVLKGAALSVRAYGSPFLRDTSDLDLFVPGRHRVRAHVVLRETGWLHVDGLAPNDATYARERDGHRCFVEVHSALADAPIVRHVQLPPPEWSATEIAGVTVPAHDGPTLAPYLAVHLAKHTSAPLLWVMDFDAIWTSLDEAARLKARTVARRAGAAGYLDLAIRRASALHDAAHGDRRAQRRCGGASGLYKERHAAIVGALAAPTPLVSARILAGWLKRRAIALGAPKPWASSGRLSWLDRAVAPLRRGSARSQASPVAERVVQLDVDSSLEVIRDLLEAGNAVWLVARGGSMSPTIRSGTHVLVIPRQAAQPLQRGDVVLATLGDGAPVMHRVHEMRDGRVVLRGDASSFVDAPIEERAIIGHVTHLRKRGRVQALGSRPAPSLRAAARRVLALGGDA